MVLLLTLPYHFYYSGLEHTLRTYNPIILDTKIFENANTLKYENIQLTIQNEKLRLSGGSTGNVGDQERIQYLEQRLLAQQEELTELHRRKGENSQQIIDFNKKLQEKEKELATSEQR